MGHNSYWGGFLSFGRLANPENRDAFGIIVSYAVKVKLFLGALGGEVSAELPFVLMHPKVFGGFDQKLLSLHHRNETI